MKIVSDTCIAEGCNGPSKVPGTARGLCPVHYLEFLWARPHKQCLVEDCTLSANAPGTSLGYCSKHLYRVKTHGAPDKLSRIPNGLSLMERLDAKLDKTEECWIWTDKSRALMYEGKSQAAMKLVWKVYGNPEPDETQVLVSLCKVKNCMNPAHIDLRTKFHLRERERVLTVEERFDGKYTVNAATGCWEWTEGLFPETGYAQFSQDGTNGTGHAYAYGRYIGDVPEGLVLDHLCEVRHCVNPRHLEPVTRGENSRRGFFRPLDKRVAGIVYRESRYAAAE